MAEILSLSECPSMFDISLSLASKLVCIPKTILALSVISAFVSGFNYLSPSLEPRKKCGKSQFGLRNRLKQKVTM